MHLTGHKESGTKFILREKWSPDGTDFKESNFRDFSVPPGHMACMGEDIARLGDSQNRRYLTLVINTLDWDLFGTWGYLCVKL